MSRKTKTLNLTNLSRKTLLEGQRVSVSLPHVSLLVRLLGDEPSVSNL